MAGKEGDKVPVNASSENESTADLLLDNFVALQKILADVSIKLTNLIDQISNLLKLFESAAKSFKDKKEIEKNELSNFSEKVNQLAEQSKTIAKGLSLVEEEIATKTKPKPLPEFRF